jgi:hypothetical protein
MDVHQTDKTKKENKKNSMMNKEKKGKVAHIS